MHIAFVDFIYHYDAARPDRDEPLGGTTSAICFLARELVKAGVSCTFFNRIAEKSEAHGIPALPLQALADELGTGRYDAFVFCGRWTDELVQLVKQNTTVPLIGWMHESSFAPPMTPALDAFDGMVFVSEWQKRINQAAAKPNWQQIVIRNAMNPRVAESFPPEAPILAAKETPPVLLFAGSFARGAFHIPPLLDKIRAQVSDFTVELYCNTDPSKNAEQDTAYINWLRNLSNISHVGMVGQTKLVERMRAATILLSPNPWPETSCIALIEGLASGMSVITTNRAALPETASGFANIIPIDNPDDPVRFDGAIDYEAFASKTLKLLAERAHNPVEFAAGLRRQVDYFHANYQWSQRVAPWMAFISALKGN